MNQRTIISESEKQRILKMHESQRLNQFIKEDDEMTSSGDKYKTYPLEHYDKVIKNTKDKVAFTESDLKRGKMDRTMPYYVQLYKTKAGDTWCASIRSVSSSMEGTKSYNSKIWGENKSMDYKDTRLPADTWLIVDQTPTGGDAWEEICGSNDPRFYRVKE